MYFKIIKKIEIESKNYFTSFLEISDKFLLIAKKLNKLKKINSNIIEENPINIKILKNLNFLNNKLIL